MRKFVSFFTATKFGVAEKTMFDMETEINTYSYSRGSSPRATFTIYKHAVRESPKFREKIGNNGFAFLILNTPCLSSRMTITPQHKISIRLNISFF